MGQESPANPGIPLRDVDTPALLIDLDAFERNLQRMADLAAQRNVRLRPHAKTHKSPVIARRQMALGAIGVCCQKVSEAEIMVAGGVDDVLVSNEVVGLPIRGVDGGDELAQPGRHRAGVAEVPLELAAEELVQGAVTDALTAS